MRGLAPGLGIRRGLLLRPVVSLPLPSLPALLPPAVLPVPPVVSSALTSASSSRVSRVTSLPGGVRALRPLPFREESHLRWMKVTWQSEQDAAPGGRPCQPGHLLGWGSSHSSSHPPAQADTPPQISDCLCLPSLSLGVDNVLGLPRALCLHLLLPLLFLDQGPVGFGRSH